MRGDAEALDRLWADDFVVTVPGMLVMAKPDTIGVWRTGRMKFQRYETSDVRMRVYDNAAIVRAASSERGLSAEMCLTTIGCSRRCMSSAQAGGKWSPSTPRRLRGGDCQRRLRCRRRRWSAAFKQAMRTAG